MKFNEEIGHYLDSQLNASDAATDEGAIFSGLVQGKTFDKQQLHSLKAEDNSATVKLDGQTFSIEQASDQPYYVNALLPPGEMRWNSGKPVGTPVNLTYSFMAAVPSYYNPRADGTIDFYGGYTGTGFTAFTPEQRTLAVQALNVWSAVANITFTEVSDAGDGGTIRFGYAKPNFGASGWAWTPSSYPNGGDVWLNSTVANNLTPGSWSFGTLIHEIGHALGLKHPFDMPTTMPTAQDNYQYSNMSYTQHPDMPGVRPQTPQLYDIAAIQYLYGANMNTRLNNSTYSWDTNATFIETIWDGGGIDTISAENQTRNAVINLEAGSFSSVGANRSSNAKNNVAIAYGVTIENAIGGSGSDRLFGNAINNLLQGGGSNDTLIGGRGTDTLLGGTGNDSLTGGGGVDRLTGGTGTDRFVFQSVTEGKDTITDFSVVDDTIDVSAAGFGGGLSAGAAIKPAQFTLGSAADDASERFIYNKSTGTLLFDVDGIGGTGQVQFATLSAGLAMTNNDIFVV